MTRARRGLAGHDGALDLAPLTAPVDRAAVRALTARVLERDGVRPVPIAEGIALAVAIPGLLWLAAVLIPIAVAAAADAVRTPDAPSVVVAVVLAVLPIAAFCGAGALGAVAVAAAGRGARWVRLDRFAAANGLRFEPAPRPAAGPGMLASAGRDATVLDAIVPDAIVPDAAGAAFGSVADLRYTVDLGRFERRVRWGVIELRLGTALPHIVLDARRNDSLFGSTLPQRSRGGQRLSLGAEFDRQFTLSCPVGYETEALRLFTPDVMARFIDRVAACDVEIVDDRLFLYVRGGVVQPDPAVWAWIDDTVAALVDRVGRWERWRDERLDGAPTVQDAPSVAPGARLLRPPRGVAAAGRRLRMGASWFAVAAGVFSVAWFLIALAVDLIPG